MHKKVPCRLLMITVLITLSIAVFLQTRKPVFNISAVEATTNIGIYWDKECTKQVSAIDWGILSPGQTKNATIYVRNEGNEFLLLVEETTNWNPTSSSKYLHFSWSYQNRRIEAGKVSTLTQTLSASPDITGISLFTFNIMFKNAKLADLGSGLPPQFFAFDEKVDCVDLALLLQCYRELAPPEAMYLADLGGGTPAKLFAFDGKVDAKDVILFILVYKG